jgi:methionine-rich copper-binding protein CopC
MRSAPPVNAIVAAGNLPVVLEFNSRIDKARSRITLRAPNGTEAALRIAPGGAATIVSSQAPAAVAGRWVIRWQVLARDGHITRGEIPFTVKPLIAR